MDSVGRIRRISIRISEEIQKVINKERLGEIISRYLAIQYEHILTNFRDNIKIFEANLTNGMYEIIDNAFKNLQIDNIFKGKYYLGVTQEIKKCDNICIYSISSRTIDTMIEILKRKVTESERSIIEMVIDFLSVSMRDQTLYETDRYNHPYLKKFEKFKIEMSEQDDDYAKILELEDLFFTENNQQHIYINQLALHSSFILIVNAAGHLGKYFDQMLNDSYLKQIFEDTFSRNVNQYLKGNTINSQLILTNAFNKKVIFHSRIVRNLTFYNDKNSK